MSRILASWIASHLPAKVVYFAFLSVWTEATIEEYPYALSLDVTCEEAADYWVKKYELYPDRGNSELSRTA